MICQKLLKMTKVNPLLLRSLTTNLIILKAKTIKQIQNLREVMIKLIAKHFK